MVFYDFLNPMQELQMTNVGCVAGDRTLKWNLELVQQSLLWLLSISWQ